MFSIFAGLLIMPVLNLAISWNYLMKIIYFGPFPKQNDRKAGGEIEKHINKVKIFIFDVYENKYLFMATC
jgi:hypothetical protein